MCYLEIEWEFAKDRFEDCRKQVCELERIMAEGCSTDDVVIQNGNVARAFAALNDAITDCMHTKQDAVWQYIMQWSELDK